MHGEVTLRYVIANSAALQLLSVMRTIAALKSKLQRTNPAEAPHKYNQMFSELVCWRHVARPCIPAASAPRIDFASALVNADNSAYSVLDIHISGVRCCERHWLPQSVRVTGVFDDATNEPLLTHAEVVELQRAIEAGLLACDARRSGAGFADATDEELILLEGQGALARQRFIRPT